MIHFITLHALNKIWRIAWPIIIYAIMDITVGLVDIFFAGYISSDAVAAIGFSRQLFLVLMIGTLAITSGTITLVAQYYGAGDYEKASSVAFHSVFLALISGVAFGLGGVLVAEPCLKLLGAKGEVLARGTQYLQILLGGVIALLLNFSVTAVFRALGDTKTPLKIALFINALNVLFNYLLLFGFWIIPPLGLKGIAIGTVLARSIGAAVSLWILSSKHRKVRFAWQREYDWTLIKMLLNIGLPSGTAGFVRNGARIVFFSILSATAAGTNALAAATIGFQIRLISIMPSLAIQVATSSLVGQSIGASRLHEAEGYGWTSLVFWSAVMAAWSLLIFLFPGWIVSLFSTEPEVYRLGILSLRFIALEQFCNCVSIVASGALSGAGDTRPSMNYTVLSQWIIMLPAAYLLSHHAGHDITGAWLAWGIAPLIQTVLTLRRFREGKWKEMQVC